MRSASLVILLMLAGCTAPEAEIDDESTPLAEPQLDSPAAPAPPDPIVIDASWQGMVADRVLACEYYATNDCYEQRVSTPDNDWIEPFPGHNLSSALLLLEWQATSPATETLTFGFMVMATDGHSNNTHFGELSGKSPLQFDLHNLDVPLGEGQVLHAYVYNPAVSEPVDRAYVYASKEQSFTVTGEVVIVPAI